MDGDSIRKSSPVMMLDSERLLFQTYAKKQGWSLGKFVRIATKAFIYQELHSLSFKDAREKAISTDVDNRERMQ